MDTQIGILQLVFLPKMHQLLYEFIQCSARKGLFLSHGVPCLEGHFLGCVHLLFPIKHHKTNVIHCKKIYNYYSIGPLCLVFFLPESK